MRCELFSAFFDLQKAICPFCFFSSFSYSLSLSLSQPHFYSFLSYSLTLSCIYSLSKGLLHIGHFYIDSLQKSPQRFSVFYIYIYIYTYISVHVSVWRTRHLSPSFNNKKKHRSDEKDEHERVTKLRQPSTKMQFIVKMFQIQRPLLDYNRREKNIFKRLHFWGLFLLLFLFQKKRERRRRRRRYTSL